MIELSVALPLYKNKDIAWLALESLCRQEGVDFKWELIICEEQLEQLGIEEIQKYQARLKQVGCEDITYIGLSYWVPLPRKWKMMAEKCASTSQGFLLQSSDDYSGPDRLKSSHTKLKQGYDWVHSRYGYFYDIRTGKTLYYDAKSINLVTGLNMAVSLVHLPKLPHSELEVGIDTWFYKSIKPVNVYWNEDQNQSLYTDGLNTISAARRVFYSKIKPPFKKCLKPVEQILPPDIYERLKKLR